MAIGDDDHPVVFLRYERHDQTFPHHLVYDIGGQEFDLPLHRLFDPQEIKSVRMKPELEEWHRQLSMRWPRIVQVEDCCLGYGRYLRLARFKFRMLEQAMMFRVRWE